jgi:hypothetical protein
MPNKDNTKRPLKCLKCHWLLHHVEWPDTDEFECMITNSPLPDCEYYKDKHDAKQ